MVRCGKCLPLSLHGLNPVITVSARVYALQSPQLLRVKLPVTGPV